MSLDELPAFMATYYPTLIMTQPFATETDQPPDATPSGVEYSRRQDASATRAGAERLQDAEPGPTTLTAALLEWERLFGADRVMNGSEALARYGADTSAATQPIAGALSLRTADEVRQAVITARTHSVAVYPISTGQNWGYGTAVPTSRDCVIFDLSGMNKILHFDPLLGVVTLEPGVTQAQLARLLEEGGHPFMVPVTGAGPTCSILGNALERGYGITPVADHFAAVTDLEAVLADGSLYRSLFREHAGDDLSRLYRWGLGPYLHGLFSQSGFGIVTSMTIQLARRPPAIASLVFSVKSDHLLGELVTRVQRLLADFPGVIGGINLMDRSRVLALSAPYPLAQVDSSGVLPPKVLEDLGHLHGAAAWSCFVTLYGTEAVVAAARSEIRKRLAGCAALLMYATTKRAQMIARLAARLPGRWGARLSTRASTLGQAMRLASGYPSELALKLPYWMRSSEQPRSSPVNPARDGCGLLWYAPLVPMRGPQVTAYVDWLRQTCRSNGFEPLITLTSLGDKLFDSSIPLLFDRADPLAVRRAHACSDQLLQEGRDRGFFPYRLGVTQQAWLHTRASSNGLESRLKRAMDPDDLISPGRYVALHRVENFYTHSPAADNDSHRVPKSDGKSKS